MIRLPQPISPDEQNLPLKITTNLAQNKSGTRARGRSTSTVKLQAVGVGNCPSWKKGEKIYFTEKR